MPVTHPASANAQASRDLLRPAPGAITDEPSGGAFAWGSSMQPAPRVFYFDADSLNGEWRRMGLD